MFLNGSGCCLEAFRWASGGLLGGHPQGHKRPCTFDVVVQCLMGLSRGPPWPILGPPWPVLGLSWVLLGPSSALLEASCGATGDRITSARLCGASWGCLGAALAPLGVIMACLGPILGCLGAFKCASGGLRRGILEAASDRITSARLCGASWGCLGAALAHLRGRHGLSWGL